MPFTLSNFKKTLDSSFKQLQKDQSDALAVQIAANYVAGQTAAETHKSSIPEHKSPEHGYPELISAEEEDLTDEQKEEIALLVALYLGYISKFNDTAKAQIVTKAEEILDSGGTEQEVKKYVDDVLSGKETIVIDNTGQKRKEIYVDKNMKLSEVTRTVEKPFYASVLMYASMTGENAAHTAYEKGRTTQNINNGYNKWVFVGPADEKARAHHVAILGQVFTWSTEQSRYAEQCLQEPRCRHRSQVYYGDSRDTPAEEWQKLKDDAGLKWSDEKEEWIIE